MALKLDKESIRAAVAGLRFRTQAFIDGRFQDSASGKTFTAENPATGRELTQIASCDTTDVDRAVAAARRAFDTGVWSKMPPAARKHILLKFADLIEKHALEIALLDALEAGKPISDCTAIDVEDTIHCFRWHAEATDKLYDQLAPTGLENVGIIVREPLGVVGAVIPWNFPVQMAAWKLGPALSTGNSVVLKPAKLTSLSAIRLAELASEAGLPDGVLNVVPGRGDTIGQALGRHMDVDAVTFTGSTEVGRYFLKYAAESNLKRIMLELGGKSPQVVMPDADLDAAAPHVVNAVFWNMGENCSAGSRLIVHKDVKDALVEKVVAVTKTWPIGDPLDPAVRVGPMIERPHMEKVLDYIRIGNEEGARLVCGGKQTLQETGGYFIEPTIFDGVDNRMRIAQEEIFGPVLSVITFSDEAEAIAIANDSPYGLASSLHTRDVHAAHRIARALRAGTVAVNCFSEGDITAPFGGFKQSGFGSRDKSALAHTQYTEAKCIWMQINPAS